MNAAELRDVEALQKILFLLSISVAHELVHMLMGFMFGDSERLTPPVINHPPGTPRGPRAGESGRYWEAKFFGCVVEAHHDPRDPRGSNQAGIFFGTLDGRRSFPMQHQIIMRYVQLGKTRDIPCPSQLTQVFCRFHSSNLQFQHCNISNIRWCGRHARYSATF